MGGTQAVIDDAQGRRDTVALRRLQQPVACQAI